MPKITIDGMEIDVAPGTTILQAAEIAGIEIPRFCYHDRLSIAGNCRMCLVDVEKSPKPVASCAMPAGEGMVVHTKSDKAFKSRAGVMEFLLINHPLDCPICDQGGECDLQDQAMAYGFDRGRFEENKRAVKDKYMGPVVSTIMTRCIHCTRCVRFATEIAGVPELGATGRGEDMEITTYLEKALDSELSGCVVDLCPVGALTSKPYEFKARSWELRKTESIDVLDAVGSNIRVDVRGREVMRILPRINEDVNEEWLGDKSRLACDGLKYQRLDQPYVRRDGKLVSASWQDAFDAIASKARGLPGNKIASIAGDMMDCESMIALKDLMTMLGSANLDCRQDGAALDPSVRASYLFNSTIAGIEKADVILIIGSNPRKEAPVLNARIRKRYLQGGFQAGVIGEELDLTYEYNHLGDTADVLAKIADGSHPFAAVLKNAEAPMLILGMAALTRSDSEAILAAARALSNSYGLVKDGWNGFNVLHTAGARVGALDIGFVPGPGGKGTRDILDGARKGEIELLYLLGADEIDTRGLDKVFVVYQGHHGDHGAHCADVILPGAAFTEKDGTYVNTEGRPQKAYRASFPPGDAREDWAIIRALSEILDKKLPYDNLSQMRKRLSDVNSVFSTVDIVEPAEWTSFGGVGSINSTGFDYPIKNYYMTDSISRASQTMARCTEMFVSDEIKKTGTDD
ncbi:MAG: NADH-quinone oxidoreductase subunit G [Candidatus Marinimicrobia bacterium]|nr:NADH-quinone oxidoreductase subunit G [Candidatus Neomarinimicrobiota bacterium]